MKITSLINMKLPTILFLITGAFIFSNAQYPKSDTTLLLCHTPAQKIDTLKLADSSLVVINCNTTFRLYDSSSLGKCIQTNGQIYIERPSNARDTLSLVYRGRIIQILNAAINITNYDSRQLTIIIEKGCALVKPDNSESYPILEHTMTSFSQSKVSLKGIDDITDYSEWRKGIYYFNEDNTMLDILETMSHIYGQIFLFDEQKAKAVHMFGPVDIHDTAESTLELFKLTLVVDYEKRGNKFIVTFPKI